MRLTCCVWWTSVEGTHPKPASQSPPLVRQTQQVSVTRFLAYLRVIYFLYIFSPVVYRMLLLLFFIYLLQALFLLHISYSFITFFFLSDDSQREAIRLANVKKLIWSCFLSSQHQQAAITFLWILIYQLCFLFPYLVSENFLRSFVRVRHFYMRCSNINSLWKYVPVCS